MSDRTFTNCGVCLAAAGLVGFAFTFPNLNSPTPDTTPTSTEASVTVDASDSLTYRPIRALGDNWYLVEVAYPHVCDNPFPIGKAKMVMVVPHLVRMHASELDELDNTRGD